MKSNGTKKKQTKSVGNICVCMTTKLSHHFTYITIAVFFFVLFVSFDEKLSQKVQDRWKQS